MSGLHGHLDLLCALDTRGISSLQRQSFRAPFHVSKPHFDAGVLVVNVANPSAGFLSGDRAICRVEVTEGAALLLTTPAANRAFRMRDRAAEVEQHFTVAEGAWLEVWPELFIPHAGARYRQKSEIHAAEGAEVLFFETLAPGRTAAGEVFAYASLCWETDVWCGDRLVARERYTLDPQGAAVRALRGQFPEAYYATCFAISPRLPPEHPCWRELEAMQSADLWVGCSALVHGGSVVKLLASGPVALRRAMGEVRARLHAALGRPVPDLRRISPAG